jgi:Uma2 family endonuclease
MTLSWPDHLLTLEEWEAVPAGAAVRLEIAEGVLVMSPRPALRHQHAGNQLTYRHNEQLPSDFVALAEVEVVLSEVPPTIRVPDVIVVPTAVFDPDPPRVDASDVQLAIEVLSDGTRRIDRVMKFSEYADAGIPQYWIVDLAPPTTLLAYILVDGDYELSGEHSGRIQLTVAGHPVTLDLDALTRR